ncbi:iron uptake cluster protein [Irpex lacteus]|nr:iron uptake cluster protein [Irpex lacteus]
MALKKTVVVLGGSYGGNHAAQILSQSLPPDWRVVLIDRNSHINHLYVLPRMAALPHHAHKAFIPYTNVLTNEGPSKRHLFLHAQVTSLSQHSLTLSRSFPEYGIGKEGEPATLEFEYAVYALGSHLPSPINLWGPVHEKDDGHLHDGTKAKAVSWLSRFRANLEGARSVLVVGGGALGIQYASDIKEVLPSLRVTLLHSRKQLLPRFDSAMHEEILSSLTAMGVDVILGERLDLSSPPKEVVNEDGVLERVARTQSGREIQAGVVLLCTGQIPNTALMRSVIPESIVPDGPAKGSIRVKRTLQVAVPRPQDTDQTAVSSKTVQSDDLEDDADDDEHLQVPYPHWFAVGDAADAFGAINAGHTAYYQGGLAANNVLKLIAAEREGKSPEETELEHYYPGEPGIKISLGLNKSVYHVNGEMGTKTDVPEDLDAGYMWKAFGIEPTEEGMHL